MYRVYIDGTPLHHPNLFYSDVILGDPVLETAINTQGSLRFTIHPTHPSRDAIRERSGIISVRDGSGTIWRGRIISTSKTLGGSLEVYCEGELAFLMDSIARPYVWNGNLTSFLAKIINDHNSQVDDARKFAVGTITVSPPGGQIRREWSAAKTSWEIIKSELLESSLGGYIQTRRVGSTTYIDYLQDFDTVSGQEIRYGHNLVDLVQERDTSNLVTMLIPYGAEIPDDDPTHEEKPASGSWDGNRYTIRSFTGGQDYVSNDVGVALYGQIWGAATYDDITVPANLYAKATNELVQRIANESILTISASALDRSVIEDVSRLDVGTYVHVRSVPHDVDLQMLITSKRLPLSDPARSEITLGAGQKTLTGLRAGTR